MTDTPAPEPSADCRHCRKPAALCICDSVTPIEHKVAMLILQHPQEQDRTLGTARLTTRALARAELKVGLSWPNLGKIIGRTVDPQRWAVLYLGSTDAGKLAPERELVLVNKKGEAESNQDAGLRALEGVVLLDGTWSQAKALWWRNPWMLKLRRIVLNPRAPSRYGKLRREPRRDALATIEAAGLLLSRLEQRPEIETALTETFERMLAKFRASGMTLPRAPDRRRGRGRDHRRRRA